MDDKFSLAGWLVYVFTRVDMRERDGMSQRARTYTLRYVMRVNCHQHNERRMDKGGRSVRCEV